MPPLLLPALFQGGLSLIQMMRGLSMNPQRPTYNIPQEVQDKLGQQQVNLNARSAGAARAQDNLFANQATTLQNAQQAGGGASNQLLAGAMSQAQSNRGFQDLSSGERDDYQRRLGNLGQAQSEMGSFRDRAFEINKMQPYQDAAATKSALIEGGIQNMFGALQSAPPLSFGQGQQQQRMSPMQQLPTMMPPQGGLRSMYNIPSLMTTRPSQFDYYNSGRSGLMG